MAAWVLDIILEYLVRLVIRIVQLVRSRSWPPVAAKVTYSLYVKAGVGCDIAEIGYKYRFKGESYAGVYKNPMLFSSLAENYVARLAPGTELIIRIKPGDPSTSIMDKVGPARTTDPEPVNAKSD